jgi:hypothetical protein
MTKTTFTTTTEDRYLEDYVEGVIHEFGDHHHYRKRHHRIWKEI